MARSQTITVHGAVIARLRPKLVLKVEFERENDGRWIADVLGVPGCIAHGETRKVSLTRVRRILQKHLKLVEKHGGTLAQHPQWAQLVVSA